ncbi:uncharacterized protein LOC102611312 isoform X5 [Citrus sinensis]|uniref:uncharacterized protein LOC102611312 isoform X5 n=1 Tax=Citrus sinensis TaxID=2711 RepID=UPI002278FE0E|nr:uncharacterized protein LOC102611312 isoform X5 [Citrus sinensis]
MYGNTTGVMESQTANQLPEANTLPDGFVDSSTEDLAPLTPNVEQEKPHGDYKEEGFAGLGDSSESRHEFASKEFQTSEVDLAEVPSKGSVEHRESAVINPNSAAVSEASAGASGCCKVKGQVQEECQNIESSIEERSEAQGINKKDVSVSESDDTLKNRKPENTETRRKSSKRTFKSEKEFLEFTLKYQQVLAERDAAMAVRDKLESLCRELQRQNKMLMDECKRVSSEGQNLRLDLSAKFQDAIKDVSIKLEEQKDDCLSQLKENEMLRTNLKQLADQYALTEQQYAQKLKQKTLELQIGELKIKQHEEKLVQEQSQMKLYAEQVSQLLATEKNLRLQLTADGEKFQQFQDALVKSNEVFETFKQEIEKMAKSIKELKQENMFLKRKCETSDIIRIELLKWLVGLHVQVFILSFVNNNYVISIHHKTILHKMDNSRFSCCLVHPPLWQAL